MKKIIALLATIFISTSIQTKGFANELEDSFIHKAGITPISIFYSIDVAIDNLRITLASGEENKINTIMDVAEERLGESQVLLDKGQEEKASELIKEYQDKMDAITEKVDNKIEEVVIADQTTTETTDPSTATKDAKDEDAVKKIEEIHNRIASRQEKAIKVLNRIKEKENMPEEVKEKIQAVIQMQTVKAEAVSKFVEERHQFNAAKKAYNEAKEALKKAEESGDAAAIEAAKVSLSQLEQAKNEAKEELKVAFDAKKEAIKQANEAKKEIFKEIKEEHKQKKQEKKEEHKQKIEDKKDKIKEQQEQAKEKAKERKEQAEEKTKAKREEIKNKYENHKDQRNQDNDQNDQDNDNQDNGEVTKIN